MKRLLFFVILSSVILNFSFSQKKSDIKQASTEKRINEILSKMTLEEKVGQLVKFSLSGSGKEYKKKKEKYLNLIRKGLIGSFLNVKGIKERNLIQKVAVEESRLGIPLIFGIDVIHGYRTIFPIPLAQAASWDPELVKKSARIAAIEATAGGIDWTFAPMIDIARDPRWGRIAEGYGEDPFLASRMSFAAVKGFQDEDISSPTSLVACLKHYVAYGAAIGGRDYNSVDISEKTLREIYLPPYEAGIKAGALTVMSAFNSINGIPASANYFTIRKILKNDFSFKGFVVSDWESIKETINHGFSKDEKDAALKGLIAGVDMDMESGVYLKYLPELVREGKIDEKILNDSVKRVLRVKILKGLFENPYKDENRTNEILTNEKRKFERKVAQRSIILLKNKNSVLPIKKFPEKIAVIGPLAKDKKTPLGCWSLYGRAEDVISAFEGIKNKVKNGVKIFYSKGSEIRGFIKGGIEEAVKISKNADIVLLFLGDNISGEDASLAHLKLPEPQLKLIKEISKNTSSPIITIIIDGRPRPINSIVKYSDAVLLAWYLGIESGNAIADVLFGDYNPSAKLPVTIPRAIGQIPIYYNHENTGRPLIKNKPRNFSRYRDESNEPLFPFGFGLSYTKFSYSDLRISPEKAHANEKIKVSVKVKNTGNFDGEEIVELYIRDLVSSIIRPVKELKGFKKIKLKAGESKVISFILDEKLLGFHYKGNRITVEPGKFKVWVGPSSQEGLEGEFTILE